MVEIGIVHSREDVAVAVSGELDGESCEGEFVGAGDGPVEVHEDELAVASERVLEDGVVGDREVRDVLQE